MPQPVCESLLPCLNLRSRDNNYDPGWLLRHCVFLLSATWLGNPTDFVAWCCVFPAIATPKCICFF